MSIFLCLRKSFSIISNQFRLFKYLCQNLNLDNLKFNEYTWQFHYDYSLESIDLTSYGIRKIVSPPSVEYESFHLVLYDNTKCKYIQRLTTIEWIYKEYKYMDNPQKKLKSYIKKIIKKEGFSVTESNRHCYHIRFKFSGNIKVFNEFFKKYNIEVELSSRSCSLKSPTYTLKTMQCIEDIPKHTELYWVNNETSLAKTGSNLFATKDLSPENLKITEKLLNTEQLIEIVSKSVIKKYNDKVASELVDLLKYAQKKQNIIFFDKDLIFIHDDLVVISKDYGEILAAIWIMSNLNFKHVYFPKNSNEKLIDFYGEKISICYPISVKSGNGSKVFLKNVIDAVNKRKKPSIRVKKQKVLDIIKIASENTMKSQMILLHQYLKTRMIEDLSLILGIPVDDITLEKVKKWSQNKTVDELKEILLQWWKKYSMPRKFDMDDKERLVIAPLGEKIKFLLNEDKELQESLTYLAKHIALLQINVDVSTNKIIFKQSFFKEGKFQFDWQGYSSGNRLGFKKIN